jgi:hypothetical protein
MDKIQKIKREIVQLQMDAKSRWKAGECVQYIHNKIDRLKHQLEEITNG